MKLAITLQSPDPQSAVDPRFGRARSFLVIDTQTGQRELVDNTPNLQAAQGAGIQSARRCAELGVQAVLTGQVGPKAFSILNAEGIAVHTGATGSVDEVLVAYGDGKLPAAAQATREGHWS